MDPCAKERLKEYRERPEVKERARVSVKKYAAKPEVKMKVKEYEQRVDVKERRKTYAAKPEVKERIKEYRERPEVKERIKEYRESVEYRTKRAEYMYNYRKTQKGKEILELWRSKPESKKRHRERCKLNGASHYGRAIRQGNYAERVRRLDVFTRDKFRCTYCKKKLKLEDCVLEHKIPIAKGGSHTVENCTTSCQPCNSAKAAKLLDGLQISIFDVVK